MRRRPFAARCGVLAAGLLAAVVALPDGARAGTHPGAAPVAAGPAVLTDAQIAALSPQAQAARLAPLRAVANAVGEVGRGPAADVYGNLAIDADHGVVTVYLTDPRQAQRVLAATEAVDPGIDSARIRFRSAAATHAALDAAARHVVALADAGRLPVHVDMVGPAPDASGLEVDVDADSASPATSPSLAASLGVPVSYRPGHTLQAKSWADTK